MRKSGVLNAVIIGSLTGFLGFGIFISVILIGERKEVTGEIPVSTNEGIEEVAIHLSALQYGVFSSVDSATSFMKDFSNLNVAAIIPIEDKYYVWSKLSVDKGDKEQTIPSSFWKEIKVTNGCSEFPELLTVLQNLTENNLMDIEGISSKIPNYMVKTLQSVGQLSNDSNVWRLHLVSEDISQKGCLKLNF